MPLATGIPTGAALATEDPPLEEVIVTGERQTRTLSATASSVSVVDRNAIDAAAGADRLEQFLVGMPNIQLGSGTEGPSIRGQDSTGVLRDLPAFLGGARPRSTLQVDGRAVSFNEFVFGVAPVWDVERIEVFRSPQTTTQGRNSIAGAVFVQSREPTWRWEGAARLLAGNERTRQGSVVISGPLVDDQLAFRLAGDLRKSRTSSHIADFIAGADPNEDRYGLVRLRLRAEPDAHPDLRITTTYVHSDSTMPQIEGVRAPFSARTDPAPTYGVFSTNVDSLTLVVQQGLPGGALWTTTLSAGDAAVDRFAPVGLGQAQTRSRDYSFESLLHDSSGEALRLFAGVHASQVKLEQSINLNAVLGAGRFHDAQHSLGLFGEVRMNPWRRLWASAGLRFQHDSQDRRGALTSTRASYPIAFDRSFAAWLPKLTLSWEAQGGSSAGVMVQKAFNPGGVSFNFDTGAQSAFAAETLWNFEVFTRLSLAQGRAFINANLFRNNGHDSQRARTRAYTVPGGATAFWAEIQNVPSTRSQGLEAQLIWRVHPRLQVRGGLGLLDTRIVESVNGVQQVRDFQRSPSLTASAGVDWRISGAVRVGLSGNHHGAYFSDDSNTPALRIAAATVLDARVSLQRKRWTLSAYATNLLDRFYMTSLSSPVRGTAGDPLQFGAGVEARF